MAEEVRADPTEIAKLAGETLKASTTLNDGFVDAQSALGVPPSAFGNSHVGPSVSQSHQAVAELAQGAVERLVGVLEGDVDRLYRVAFAYQETDRESADRVSEAGRRGGAR